jgi:ABC-type lipoprotein export system ATPase subunit
MAAAEPFLQLSDVTKQYESPAGPAVSVLSGVNLTVSPGESVAVVGPSGCGKTTLLNIIGTLDRPTSGRVVCGGRDLLELSERALAEFRNRQIGFIFQAHHLLPQCTVLENVLVPILGAKNEVLRDGAPDRARRLLDKVGLGNRLQHRPAQLSGGECQRVAVVRALINEPALLLADEPTGALDRGSAEKLGELLLDLNQETGVTLIVVTHSLDLAGRMRRRWELGDGRLTSR